MTTTENEDFAKYFMGPLYGMTALLFLIVYMVVPSKQQAAEAREKHNLIVSVCEADPLYVGKVESCVRLKSEYNQ